MLFDADKFGIDFDFTNLLNSFAVRTGIPETLRIWSPMWNALYRTG